MENQSKTAHDLGFNPESPTVMHIDLNSCFATIEQQANPFLRNKPVAVAAYNSPNGCILAASYEAKKFGSGGIETGMRVKDAKKICPDLIVVTPDPWKYRNIHLAFRKILEDYTNDFSPKSIDEFVLDLQGYPALQKKSMEEIGKEIKVRIKKEIGEYLTVSIGIATNRFLAKTASNLQKPDGLSAITINNYKEIFQKYPVTFLCGIKTGNARRLHRMGIISVYDFYNAKLWVLRAAFHSITSYYWYLRLRGYEIDSTPFGRRSYGNSYSLPQAFSKPYELAPTLTKLVTKMSTRMRRAGYAAHGVHLAISYKDNKDSFWHKHGSAHWSKGRTFSRALFETAEIYKEAYKLLCLSPYRLPVRNLAVSCFDLLQKHNLQLELFDDAIKKEEKANAMDSINNQYGEFVLTPARMIDTGKLVPDRIAFGNVKELEEFTINR